MIDVTLQEFRETIDAMMPNTGIRPFVCDGSPLRCSVFIVGFNPATTLPRPFWDYWSDESGFKRGRFMEDYRATRPLRGVRPRIERIVAQLPAVAVLETNICATPTRRAADLRRAHRGTEIFRYLLRAIRPRVVFAHSDEPIAYLRELTGCSGFEATPQTATVDDHSFVLSGRRGPLFRASFADADRIGKSLAWILAEFQP